MCRTAQRPDRINLRFSPQAKRRLERAAGYSKTTLNDFIVDTALQKADAILEQQDTVTLTGEEWERFHACCSIRPSRTSASAAPQRSTSGLSAGEICCQTILL